MSEDKKPSVSVVNETGKFIGVVEGIAVVAVIGLTAYLGYETFSGISTALSGISSFFWTPGTPAAPPTQDQIDAAEKDKLLFNRDQDNRVSAEKILESDDSKGYSDMIFRGAARTWAEDNLKKFESDDTYSPYVHSAIAVAAVMKYEYEKQKGQKTKEAYYELLSIYRLDINLTDRMHELLQTTGLPKQIEDAVQANLADPMFVGMYTQMIGSDLRRPSEWLQ